jgi:O-antigen/teichoic acid export membrane protein
MTWLSTRSELGLYALATTIAGIPALVAASMLAPLRTRAAKGDNDIIAKCTAAALWLTAGIGITIGITAPFVIPQFLGRSFAGAVPMLWWLLIAQVPLAGAVVLTGALIGAGHPGSASNGEVVALIIGIPLLVLFLPRWGGVAAAIVSGASYSVSFGYLLRRANKEFSARIREYLIPDLSRLQAIGLPVKAFSSNPGRHSASRRRAARDDKRS